MNVRLFAAHSYTQIGTEKGSAQSSRVPSGTSSSIPRECVSLYTFPPERTFENPLVKAKWFNDFHCQTLKRDFDKVKKYK